MFAVLKNGTCTIRQAEVAGSQLILRPHNQSYPNEVISVQEGKPTVDYVVGRVCYVGLEV